MARSSSGGDWILPAYVNAPNSRILVSQSAGSPCRNWANSVSTWVDGCCMVIAPELRPGGKTIQLSINGVNFQIDKTGLRQRVGANEAPPPPPSPGPTVRRRRARGARGGCPLRDMDEGVMPAPFSCARPETGGRIDPLLWPSGPQARVPRLVQGSCVGLPLRVMRPLDPSARPAAWPPAGGRASSPAAGTACAPHRPPTVTQDEEPRSTRPPRHPSRGPRPVGPLETPWNWRPQRPPRSPAGPRWAAPPAAAAGRA